MYSISLFIEQVGLYKGRMFAVKDCYGSQMMDITRDIKKELKVRGYCSKVYGRNQSVRNFCIMWRVHLFFSILTLLNIQVMKDLRHDNLNSFIGACVEPEQIRIVSEYCTRGSLR